MRRLNRSLFLPAALVVLGCVVAGCGGSGSIGGASSTRSGISLPSRSVTAQPSAPALPSKSASVPAGGAPAVTPSTVAPTLTAQPSSPAQPTAAAPTVLPSSAAAPLAPSVQPSSEAAPAGDSVVIWPWILLGVIVVIGIVLLVRRSSGRKSTAASWRSQVIDAYAKGAALYDAMSVAETPAALAADDAGARWSDIQRRADDLAQTLYALREAAVDEDDRAVVADTLAWLQVIRSAMDAERAPAGAGSGQAAIVRSRLESFEASLRALRATSDPQ
ncbi:MAG TPA: hypothetical protein VIJ82_10845 [Streptosporangiaceae bacterium]|jgi:hypothetical protein